MNRFLDMAMTIMRKLIINADDLGMSAEVNGQIEECIRLGCITSSTLMANAPAFDEGVRIAKQYSQISVGVHLNLIEFKPLTNSDIFKKHGVVGEDGCFIEGAIGCVTIGDELKQAVFEEWDAQITKVEQTGLVPSHCDSHEHTHTIRALKDVLCQVLDKHSIKHVRRTIIPSIRLMLQARKQPQEVKLDKSRAVQRKKRNVLYRRLHLFAVKYSAFKWNRAMAGQYSMTNAFYSFRDFYRNRDLLCLGGKSSVIELMCHPGNKPFQSETEHLMYDKSWLTEEYELISYNQL